MAQYRVSFEKEVRNKLEQKSNSRIGEDVALLKAFKYFDLNNSGTVDSFEFIKVLEKIGITIYGKEEFKQLFDYYDKDHSGKLDYQEFISILLDNKSGSTRKFSPQKASTYQYGFQNADDAIEKFRRRVRDRGPNGLLGLGRAFRIMDDSNTRTICMNEFRKAIYDFQIAMNEAELQIIFQYFDKQHNGAINYDEFLLAVRGQISEIRKSLCMQAFNQIDVEGAGFVNVQRLLQKYTSNQHPDVKTGRKNQDQALGEFQRIIDNYCDIHGIADGLLSSDEFVDLYSFMSFAIEDENSFEQMMQNVWQLRTSLHGSQSHSHAISQQNLQDLQINKEFQVETQKQQVQQTPKQSEKNSPKSRQNSTQSQKSQKSAYERYQEYQGKPQVQLQKQEQQPAKSSQSQQASVKSGSQRIQIAQGGQQSFNINDQLHAEDATKQKNGAPKSVSQLSSSNRSLNQSIQMGDVLCKIRKNLASRGVRGFLMFQRNFQIYNDENINYNDFCKALKDFKIDVSNEEIQSLLAHFDVDGCGLLLYEEVIKGIKGDMNSFRVDLVTKIYNRLNCENKASIDLNDIKKKFQAKYHQDVRSGKRTEDDIIGEFYDSFDTHHSLCKQVRNYQVTLSEFLDYYSNVSACIESDQSFEVLLKNSFNFQERIVETTKAETTQEKAPQVMSQSQVDHRSKTLQNAPFGTSDIQTDYRTYMRPKTAVPQLQDFQKQVTAGKASWPGFQYQQELEKYEKNKQLYSLTKSKPSAGDMESQMSSEQAELMLARFRKSLYNRGDSRGILQLGRVLRQMDINNSHQLEFPQFCASLKSIRLNLSPQEMQSMFSLFDQESVGVMNYEQFIHIVRGPLSLTRKRLIEEAYRSLDKGKVGNVHFDNIVWAFQPTLHPDVRSGRRSEDEVLGEFIDSFSIHHAMITGDFLMREKNISLEEFLEYYANISSTIDEDRYFEVMMKHCWGI